MPSLSTAEEGRDEARVEDEGSEGASGRNSRGVPLRDGSERVAGNVAEDPKSSDVRRGALAGRTKHEPRRAHRVGTLGEFRDGSERVPENVAEDAKSSVRGGGAFGGSDGGRTSPGPSGRNSRRVPLRDGSERVAGNVAEDPKSSGRRGRADERTSGRADERTSGRRRDARSGVLCEFLRVDAGTQPAWDGAREGRSGRKSRRLPLRGRAQAVAENPKFSVRGSCGRSQRHRDASRRAFPAPHGRRSPEDGAPPFDEKGWWVGATPAENPLTPRRRPCGRGS